MVAALVAVVGFHIGLTPVLSASMTPDFGAGSLVVTKPVPVSSLRAGQVIVFTPPGEPDRYVHRVVSIHGGDRPVIRTKGDANPLVDPWHARLSTATVPVVVGSVPMLGRVLVDVRHDHGRPILIALAGLLIMLIGRRLIFIPARNPGTASHAVVAHA
jgi:signal peptidase